MYRLTGVLLALVVGAPALQAQTTTGGSLRGVVTDQQGAALPGVLVRAESPSVPHVYAATTDERGRYRLLDLQPGEYVVEATLDGFARFQAPVSMRAGLGPTLDIALRVGAIDEAIEVRRDAPLLETHRAGRAVNVSGELLRSMPLEERRDWFGALILAPGVTTAEWANNERLFYVHGATSSSHVIQIDGADMTPSVAGALRFVGLNTDAIDDIEIKTAGVDASAPLGLGGVISIATASGTNDVKGTATFYRQPRVWNSSNTPGGTSATVNQLQADLSLGAPIVHDRAWAFVAYRYVDVETGISRTAAQLDALRALVPGFVPFDNTNNAHLWFAKVDTQLSPAHRLSTFYQYDVNPRTTADPGSASPSPRHTGGSGVLARLASIWSDRLTTRLTASHNDKGSRARDPGASEPFQRVHESTFPAAGRLFGTGHVVDRGSPRTTWSTQPNSKLTLSFDATALVDRWLGSHELQAGIYAQPRTSVKQSEVYANGGFLFEEAVLREPGNLAAGVVPFRRLIYDGEALTRLDQRTRNYAFYLQDAWRPMSRLTLNAGVRIDHITRVDRLFDVTGQSSTEVGPRIGLTYAVTADARNIVNAHWVRVHSQSDSSGLEAGTASLGQLDLYDLDLDGTFETSFVTPPTVSVTPNRSIDGDYHQSFVQDWGVGYSRQIDRGLTAQVDVLRRHFRDRPTLVETNGRYDGSMFVGYHDEAFNEIYRVSNNRWNSPVYTSLELSVTARARRVHGIASYVRQWRHLAGTWQPNDPASFIQPGAFGNNRAIGSTGGSTSSASLSNSLSGNSMTQVETTSAQWQDHVARVGVTLDGPWQLLFGSSYTFQSGGWSGPVVTRIDAPDPAFGPPSVTLSNGRTVANPLATTIRFAFPTRGEGQLATPHLHVWNLRLGRRFSLARVTFDASLDVFNVTNSGTDAGFAPGANQLFSPAYGSTRFTQLPRSAQGVIRASF